MAYLVVMAACWLGFMAFWAISSVNVKKDLHRHGSVWVSIAVRLVVALAAILLVRLPSVQQVLREDTHLFSLVNPAIRAVGDVVCAAGVAVAIWARVHLGANWSGRPATKEGHELVTSGPYRRVRHPIYSGMLLAMLGTSLVSGIPGFLVFVGFGAVAVYRIGVEESLMMQLFPEEYPAYRQRTRALVPFIV